MLARFSARRRCSITGFLTAGLVILAAGQGSGATQPVDGASSQARAGRPAEVRADLADPSGLEPLITRILADVDDQRKFSFVEWSEPVLAERGAFLRAQLERLARAFDDSMTVSQRVDFLLLRGELRAELAQVGLRQRQLAAMQGLLPAEQVAGLVQGWRAGKAVDSKAAARTLDQIKEMATSVLARLKNPEGKSAEAKPAAEPIEVPSAVVALRASRALGAMRQQLREWFEQYSGFEPTFGFWCKTPHAQADAAMEQLAKYLREEIAKQRGEPDDPLVGDPIGLATLTESLESEFVGRTPEELIALGQEEFAWCQNQMKLAAEQMNLGEDWRAALERVKQATVPPGEQDALVLALGREATEFVTSRNLVTVPALASKFWTTEMLSPASQRVLPFAAYTGQKMAVAYAHEQMSHADKLMAIRGNNKHFTRIVTPHELIPGHHLQGFLANRERPYRRRFSTPFYIEGWALYWEMKLWDLGWAKSPEDRIGMLFWRMHRCARITVSLKFHLGQMTPAEMVDFLVREVGHERANATAEVRRYIGGDYGPLYQAGYMIGGIQLRALHAEVMGNGTGVAAAPGAGNVAGQAASKAMDERTFNDAVLRCGPIPMELVRAEILGLSLPADAKPGWMFGRIERKVRE